jgi:hypothetical protein
MFRTRMPHYCGKRRLELQKILNLLAEEQQKQAQAGDKPDR